MKKLFTLSFALLASASLFAQIPNGNMESWTPGKVGGFKFEDPTGWFTLNSTFALFKESPVLKDSLDVHGGKYAALLVNDSVPFLGGTPSLMVLGSVDINTQQAIGGIPFTGRPFSLDGYYKYAPGTGSIDTCFFAAVLTHWNSVTNHRDSVGVAFFRSGDNLATYTSFSGPFIYFLSINPDTMQVIIASSASIVGAPVGTQLKVDDLTLSHATGITSLLDIYNVSYYPNPVSDQLNVVFNQYEKASRIEVYDILGNRITTASVRGKIIPIPVSQLAPGMYFFRIIGKDGTVLKTDNFNKVN